MKVRASWDVVVVGSGVAGLSAAVEAAERGRSVLVVEAADHLGGASAMSGAACCIVNSRLQRAEGIEDSVELALRDWMSTGGPTADEEWARQYLEASSEDVFDWLADMGITWSRVARHDGNTVARWHVPEGWGRKILTRLRERCEAAGAEIRTSTRAVALVTEADAVVGARLVHASHEQAVPARSVIVCSGGFVSNPAKLREVEALKDIPRLLSGSSPTAEGLGHDLLADVGAQFAHLDRVWVYPNGTPDPDDPSGVRGVGVRGVLGSIWLNERGERFHNEADDGARLGTPALRSQPGQTAWSVFSADELPTVTLIDNLRWGTPAGPDPVAMAEFWKTSDHAWIADDINDLASQLGLPQNAVRATVAEFDAAIDAGLETEPRLGRPLAGAHRLGVGRVAALQFFPMAQKNFGGVRTDLSGRVLDADGRAITGLFAAGEVAGMAGGHINGVAALEGTMYGPCLYSGRIAGIAAAGL